MLIPTLLACSSVAPTGTTEPATISAADAASTSSCAGYRLTTHETLGPAPTGTILETVDINSDGEDDQIVALPTGGSALYLSCGGGRFYDVARSAASLQARLAEGSPWASIFIPWEEDRATVIDGRMYRLDMLPLQSDAPADFLVQHRDGAYSLPFEECANLSLKAPRYRFDSKVDSSSSELQPLSSLHLKLAGIDVSIALDSEAQGEYSLGGVYFRDLNADGSPDAVLRYEERFGSGREAYDALLLNCGDDGYVLSGTVSRGRAGLEQATLGSESRSLCGTPFVTLEATRHLEVGDGSDPSAAPAIEHDLYLYRPTPADFFAVPGVPDPSSPEFAAHISARCPEILRRAHMPVGP